MHNKRTLCTPKNEKSEDSKAYTVVKSDRKHLTVDISSIHWIIKTDNKELHANALTTRE